MRLNISDKILRLTASSFLVSILLLQGSTIVFMAFGKPLGTWFWPIIDYPMYSVSHVEGDYINVYFTLEVEMIDGTVSKVTADDVGLNFWKFHYIGAGISKSVKASADLLVALHPKSESITEIRVYSSPFIITKSGKGLAPPKLLNKIAI